jgi:hypothetical protein
VSGLCARIAGMSATSPLDSDGFASPADSDEFEGIVVSDPAAVEATRAVARAVAVRTEETASVVELLPQEPRTAAWAALLVALADLVSTHHEIPITDVVGLADEVEPIDRVDLAEAVVDAWTAGATVEDAAATVSASADVADLGDELSDAFATVAIAAVIDVADDDGPAEVLGRVLELPHGLSSDQRRDRLLSGLAESVTAHIALLPA